MFYAKAIDLTILVAMGTLSGAQTSGTTETEKAMRKLLDYCAMYPNATLRYKARWMVLKAHSNVSFFSEPQAIIRAGGFYTWAELTRIATDKMEQLCSYRTSCGT